MNEQLGRWFCGKARSHQFPASTSVGCRSKKLIDDRKVTAVDVRTPKEYKQGHIPGAKSLPLQEGITKWTYAVER